jgi:DNA-binding XRE family transcriptional regulator
MQSYCTGVKCDPRHNAPYPRALKSPEAQADTRNVRAGYHPPYVHSATGGDSVSSNNLQRFRETLMLSKAELARKAGLSTLTIDRIEAGRPCRLDSKRKILLALGLNIMDKEKVFGPVMPESTAATQAVPGQKEHA